MRKDEIVRKNISLVFDFLRYLTDNFVKTETNVKGTEKAFVKVEHSFNLAT